MSERYLSIEAPDTEGVIDFISLGVVVRASIKDGVISVNVRASHGEGSSWDEEDFEMDLPEPEKLASTDETEQPDLDDHPLLEGATRIEYAFEHGQWWVIADFDDDRETRNFSVVDTSAGLDLEEL